MNSNRLKKTACLVGLTCLAAASCNVHDNTINIPGATVNFTTDVDTTNVAPGQEIPVMMTVEKIYLIDPSITPPAEHIADAGHVQVYMDDTSTKPLLITAEVMFNITVPVETKAGNHKLICRVHKHDGTPTTTKMELSIVVKVNGSTGDASVELDANGTVDSGAADTAGTGGGSGAGGAGGSSVGGAGGGSSTGGAGGSTSIGGAGGSISVGGAGGSISVGGAGGGSSAGGAGGS